MKPMKPPRPVCTNRLVTLIASLLLAGCTLTEAVAPPTPVLPDAWTESAAGGDAAPVSATWWQAFGSARLDRLVQEAIEASPELHIQTERMVQAELALQAAGAALFPNLSLGGDSGWQHSSTRNTARSSALQLALGYELDLWGGLGAARASAEAGFAASRHDRAAARLSLTASVASSWFHSLALKQRLDIAHDNLAIAERVLNIVKARFRHGAASAMDVSRQRTTVLALRAALDPLQVESRQTRRALALLLGRLPHQSPADDEALEALMVPSIAPGLPAELLLRRPDIAAAEARLLAAAADITVARARMLPGLSLSAAAGLSSDQVLALGNPVYQGALSLGLVQTIFDGGEHRSRVGLSRSRQRELLASYRLSLLSALKEVEDALASLARDSGQETAQQAIVAEARRTLRLAEVRYREGADELLSVLDAQRTLFAAQDQLVRLRLERLLSAVTLYKALGGGWQLG